MSYQSQDSQTSLVLTVAGSSSSNILRGGDWQGNALRENQNGADKQTGVGFLCFTPRLNRICCNGMNPQDVATEAPYMYVNGGVNTATELAFISAPPAPQNMCC